jgi:hypothetical protein
MCSRGLLKTCSSKFPALYGEAAFHRFSDPTPVVRQNLPESEPQNVNGK